MNGRNVVFPILLIVKACKARSEFPWMDVLSTAKPLKNYKIFPLCRQYFHFFLLFEHFSLLLIKIWLLRTVQVTLKIFRAILLRFSLFFLLPDKIYCRWRILAWVLKIVQKSWDVSPATLRPQAVHECLMEKQVIGDSLRDCELSTKNLLATHEPNGLLFLRSIAGKGKKKKVHGAHKSLVPIIVHCLPFL